MIEPSPEVKSILKEFVRVQRDKHGPDWKRVVAADMAKKTTPVIEALLQLRDMKK